jgi:hypothetical protein
VDKSYLLRPVLAVCLVLTLTGAAQAGQVAEKDLSDVVAPQEQIQKPTAVPDSQASAADDAKEGFSSGAKGIGDGFKSGAAATGDSFKWLGGKMGSGLKTAGTAMGSGFKTAGVSIKNFFTGKYFGFGKKDQVVEQDIKAEEAHGAAEAKTDLEQIKKEDAGEDLEMDVDSKDPKKSDWAG